ncbi:sigma-70 family RNA polymerase sigma factor [Planctomycetota bacterium]|nr:sigma-70 family RNA polymerase sigma factor [Planctomycetota bacterium]
MSTPLPQDIIKRLQHHDSDALTIVYNHYVKDLWRYVYFRTNRNRDTADDLTSIIFTSLISSVHNYNPEHASFDTWLYTIARNKIADHLRKHYRRKKLTLVSYDLNEPPSSSPTHTHAYEQADILNRTLDQLTPQQHQLLIWKYQDKLTVKQIAKKINRTNKATENLIYRARLTFKDHYNKLANAFTMTTAEPA